MTRTRCAECGKKFRVMRLWWAEVCDNCRYIGEHREFLRRANEAALAGSLFERLWHTFIVKGPRRELGGGAAMQFPPISFDDPIIDQTSWLEWQKTLEVAIEINDDE